MPFHHRFKGVLFFTAIAALVLKSAQDSAVPTSTSNSSLGEAPGTLSLNLSPITNQSQQNGALIRCERGSQSRFGRPRPISCADALNHIPSDDTFLFFGKRGTAPRGANGLPYRYISSDGECIIDIDYVGGREDTDVATYDGIKNVAETLLLQCIFVPKRVPHGGSAVGFGALGKLAMTLQEYHPRVQCSPRTRPATSLDATACQILLDRMLTTKFSQIFGQRGEPNVNVPLPQRLISPRGECSITLLMDGPPVSMTWHDIWGAAIAVAGMCIRGAKLGTAILQSGNSKISVVFDNALTSDVDVTEVKLD